MNNFFGTVYLEIADRLKAEVPELRWIDQDFGQLEHFEYKPGVSFPCALIDFIGADYDALATGSQFGNVTVQVRLGFAPFSSSQQNAPTDVKEKALAYYDIEQKIVNALHNWPSSISQVLVRKNIFTEHRENDQIGLRVRVLSFTTAYEDYSSIPNLHHVSVPLDIDLTGGIEFWRIEREFVVS
jgi:hypothetical protein